MLDYLVEQEKPVVLVGCSQGGGIAIDAALVSPGRIAALILIAPSVSVAPSPSHNETVRQLFAAIDAAEEAGEIDQVNRLEAALFLDGPMSDEGRVSGSARELFLTMNGIALAAPAIGRVRQPAPAWDRLDQIVIPVRILCGDLDIPNIEARCRELGSALPNAHFELLDGVAHLPSLEQPSRITERLLKLLAEL